jgi:osmotically-inducible protein OsmY
MRMFRLKSLLLALSLLLTLSACREATQRDTLLDFQADYSETNGLVQGPVDLEERDVRGLRPTRDIGGPGDPGNVGRYEHFEGTTPSPTDLRYLEQVRRALVEKLGPEKAEQIQVHIISGRVTLRGTVQDEQERNEVVAMVDSLMGTGSVNDELRLATDPGPQQRTPTLPQ